MDARERIEVECEMREARNLSIRYMIEADALGFNDVRDLWESQYKRIDNVLKTAYYMDSIGAHVDFEELY